MFANFLQKFGFLNKETKGETSIIIDRSYKFEKNFTPSQNRSINHLVLHHIAADSFKVAISSLKEYEVSSHYIIDESGKIFLLVEEKDIAYHAGVSFWRGQDGLNATSIGIEFYNPKPFEIPFAKKQIAAGLELCSRLVKQYQIESKNVVGHSDIAYFIDNEENRNCGIVGFLGRKQDPGPLFPWQEFYLQKIAQEIDQEILVMIQKIGNESIKSGSIIRELKIALRNFGYKIDKIDDEFDGQFESVIKSFKLRFRS